MVDLEQSREKIDIIDNEILKLFEKRMEIAKDVAEYKISCKKKVYDREREKEKLDNLKETASNDFNKQAVQELFSQIMSISRKLQYSLVNNGNQDVSFKQKKSLDVGKNTKVVYFGVKGTYTEQAMEEYFGEEVSGFSAPSFREVMQAVQDKKADYGVLPIENSSTGGITDIYDLLMDFDNYIVGEHVIKIEQALLGLEGASIDKIKKVYSHAQGLLQCSKFLEEHKGMVPVEYPSTAAGAKKVRDDKDPAQAAIAGKRAADCYGLTVLQECINFNDVNSTRFIVITNKKVYLENANKISLCFELPHESGTLYNMLSHFIFNHLNLTKIESRPIEGKNWQYRFFVDFEGNLSSPGVRNAITGVREEANSIKILGNF